MKPISAILMVLLVMLGGCVVAPVAPGYYGYHSAPGYYAPAYYPPVYYGPSVRFGIYGGHGHRYR